jgi:hypothetical protein
MLPIPRNSPRWSGFPCNPDHPSLHTVRMTEGPLHYCNKIIEMIYNSICSTFVVFEEYNNVNEKLATDSLSLIIFLIHADFHSINYDSSTLVFIIRMCLNLHTIFLLLLPLSKVVKFPTSNVPMLIAALHVLHIKSVKL